MTDHRFQHRLIIAAGALLLAGLACVAPGAGLGTVAPTATVTPLILAATPTTATEPPAEGPCMPPAPDPSISDGASWQIYCDEAHGFAFRYPSGGTSPGDQSGHGNIYLPFAPGANLAEKYIAVTATEGATTCESPNAAGYAPGTIPSETVTFNSIDFYKQTGSDAGAGNFYDWTGYSNLHGELCVNVTFILHSNSPGAFATPPPEFDKAAESAVFDPIMATFYFFTPGEAAQGPEPIPTAEGSVINSTDCNPPAPSGPDADLIISIYCDTVYKFGFRYPPVGDSGYSGTGPLTLPLKDYATNLQDKTLTVSVSEGEAVCTSPNAAGYTPGSLPSENVTFNGVAFIKESADEGAAGNFYHWESYSTTKGSICVNLTFLLHSLNAANFPTPPPEYDPAVESAMFQTIMSTFYWYGS